MRHAISIGTAVAALLALAGTTLAGPNATWRADLDGDGELSLFDFLEFQNEFDQGCPVEPIGLQMAGVPLADHPFFEATRAFNRSGIDLSDVAAIRFEFAHGGGSTIGRLGLDEIEATVDR